MKILIIGNIISFLGALIMVGTGLIKKKDKILLAQIAQFALMGIGNLVLGGVTGFITNLVGIVRNLFCYKWKFTLPFKLGFIAVQLVLAAMWNKLGLVGWLPVIAACIFTWFLDTENEVVLKAVIVFTEILWVFYDIRLLNFSSITFDTLTIITNIMGVFMLKKKEKSEPDIEF